MLRAQEQELKEYIAGKVEAERMHEQSNPFSGPRHGRHSRTRRTASPAKQLARTSPSPAKKKQQTHRINGVEMHHVAAAGGGAGGQGQQPLTMRSRPQHEQEHEQHLQRQHEQLQRQQQQQQHHQRPRQQQLPGVA